MLLALPSSSRQEEQTFPIAAFVSNWSSAVSQQQNTKKKNNKYNFFHFSAFVFLLYFVACCVSIALPSCCTAPTLCPCRVCCYFYLVIFLFFLFLHEICGNHVLPSFAYFFISSVRSSNSHPDLLVITSTSTTTPLFQITPVLNTGLSLSEPLQLYKGYNAI